MDAGLHPIYFQSMSVGLNIPNFAFRNVPKYDFVMLTSDHINTHVLVDLSMHQEHALYRWNSDKSYMDVV